MRGPVSVQRLVGRACELGYEAVALADVNVMYGVVDFCKTARKAGVKPIIGVQIVDERGRVVLLAENEVGYRNLCRIVTARNLEPDFELVGRLSDYSEGLICICGKRRLLDRLKGVFRSDCLFWPCRDEADAEQPPLRKVRAVACGVFDCVTEDDVTTGRLLAGIRRLSGAGATRRDESSFNVIVGVDDLAGRYGRFGDAVKNAAEIAGRCSVDLLDRGYFLPRAKLPPGRDGHIELSRLCHRRLAEKYNPVTKEVVKRLEYELNVIRENRFSDYFLVVHQIVEYAKRRRIPVDVRGSAAGSLVAHVLGFTRVCPIKNGLYFERFMNPGRRDCPDIDIDLCWRRRDEVIRFCYENWGQQYVAMISNINRYRRRSAVRDTGRFLGFDRERINQFVGQSRPAAAAAVVYGLAGRILGYPRGVGVHCGGMVITPLPIAELAPLERAAKGVVITQYDKDAAEAVGLIKIDLLGNRALSTVDGAVNIITHNGDKLDVDAVDPADEKTARMLSAGDSLGVFQCESPAMRQLLRALKVRNKKDVATALSLVRPGPASGGMKAEFIERHVNKKPFRYLHPRLEELLGDTYGVMLYQEDVMRIAVELAGYSVAEADRFRSEVSKKVSASHLHKQYKDFVYSRAESAGIDRHSAEVIWDHILRFAAYSYCKAHATVYANIAWQTAYLKAHHRWQFYTSLLNNHQGMYPLGVYVWDAKRHGVQVLGPHVNESELEWKLQRGGSARPWGNGFAGTAIRAGLGIIKGLSHNTIDEIISRRKERPFADLEDLRRRVRFRGSELQDLVRVGACDGLGPSRHQMLREAEASLRDARQPLLFKIYDDGLKLRRYNRAERLKAELELTGIGFSMHPSLLAGGGYVPAARLGRFIDREVAVAGDVVTARRAVTGEGKLMGFVTLEDFSGLAEVTFLPEQIEQYQQLCQVEGLVWVRGRVTEHLASVAVRCRSWGFAA